MRFSKMFIPTLREVPADAEAASHVLMLRAGYVRQLAAGLYIYLPLGIRVMEKINRILREEMNAIGAQEFSLPILHPAEIWQQTGRWHDIGPEMFRLKDRKGSDLALAMTHEEVVTWLAAREIPSTPKLKTACSSTEWCPRPTMRRISAAACAASTLRSRSPMASGE